jgi:hypothetical protein
MGVFACYENMTLLSNYKLLNRNINFKSEPFHCPHSLFPAVAIKRNKAMCHTSQGVHIPVKGKNVVPVLN